MRGIITGRKAAQQPTLSRSVEASAAPRVLCYTFRESVCDFANTVIPTSAARRDLGKGKSVTAARDSSGRYRSLRNDGLRQLHPERVCDAHAARASKPDAASTFIHPAVLQKSFGATTMRSY